MNYSLRSKSSFKETRRWLAALLTFALLMTSFSGVVNAAEDTVTGIEFTYDSSDFNSSTSSLQTFVEDDKVNLSVFASDSSSSSKKDVTSDATWKSSNTALVKVESGMLTGVGKGTATISATYKGYTISIKAASDYVYDSVTLMQNNTTAPEKMDIEIGNTLSFTLNGTKANVTKDITDDAVWTTSNSAVATVDDGTLTIVGVGTVTITAKYKGKSDAITIIVSSPYKSITIDPGSLVELTIGSDDKELTASVAPKTGGTLEVTEEAKWVSANEKIVTVNKGVLSPVSAGKTTVTVSYKGVTASIDVVVRSAYQSIKLSPEKEYHMLLQDAPLQVTAEVLSNSNVTDLVTNKAVWTSSNVVVATVYEGKVTPKAVGTTKITAAYMGISRSIDITVYPSVTGISIETETIDGYVDISEDLPVVMATTFDGSKVDVSKLVSWTSEDEKVAIIKDGKWLAKAIGETELTATLDGKRQKLNSLFM